MNKKYFIGLIVFSFFTLAGCVDLDTLPEGNTVTDSQKEEVYKSDPSKASAAVNAIFAQFTQYMPNQTALGASRHNDFGYPSVMMFTDMNGCDVVSDDNGYNWAGNSLDFTDRDYSSRESQIVWNDMYKIISTSNAVIGAIPSDTELPLSKFYRAQGLAVRAFSYFVLAQLYQFNYVGHQTSPCVPIITYENVDASAVYGSTRATVEEVYNFIKTDIDTAIVLLSEAEAEGVVRDDKRYVSLAVAYGIRARVNLTMQNWTAAAADATSAIAEFEGAPAGLTDVNKPAFWTVNENNWMWGIIVAETDDVVSSGIVNWISHMGSLNYGYANFSKGRQINKALFNSIPATDVRKGWWWDENKTSPNLTAAQQTTMVGYGYPPYTQVKFAPYNNVLKTAINANDMPLMRVEEMYLIKAEAEGMSGGDGVTTLENFIKTYRDPSYTYTESNFQKEVFRQRRIELWGEGLNWFDIMRLGVGVDRRGGGYPNATMIFNIEPNDNILLWRLPEAEIQANPGLSEADNNPVGTMPLPVDDL